MCNINKKIFNLSFFPLEVIQNSFLEIKKEAEFLGVYESMKQFFEYYKSTYIIDNAEHVKCSMYELTFWSCHERIINDIPRSTNSVEGWHRSLNNYTFVSHPNIGKFIQIIKTNVKKIELL
jgi:hypothetical protein